MKDKNVAGILALFFGGLGIHRFYLGQTGLGIFYLFFFWFPIMWIVGLIDAIAFFSMDKENFDYKYNRAYLDGYQQRRDTDFERRSYQRRNRYEEKQRRRQSYREERRRPQTQYNRETSRPRPQPRPEPKRNNPYKVSGIRKYKEYDYDDAIKDFEKALEIDPKDIAVHFNLACAHSLVEDADKAFYHLDKAVEYGFNDFKRVKEHDALAYLRIQDKFEEFEQNGFRLVQQLEAPKDDLLSTSTDLLDQLKKLGELREKGLLTEEEFAAQKRKLLN